MQVSELFRRGVVMPTGATAEEALREGDVDADTEVVWIQIPGGDGFFDRIWQSQIFERINDALDRCIDDYADEWIEPSDLDLLSSIVDRTRDEASCEELREWLQHLSELAARAQRERRPLLFVL